MIKTIYVSRVGRNYRVSEHFTIGEFQCSDGSDMVKYSTDLVKKLEELRSYTGGSIVIVSGYRSEAKNKAVGGAKSSRHLKGDAADVTVKVNGKAINGKLLCCLCADLGFKGVALNKGSGNAVHLDMRPLGKYRGDENKGYSNNVPNGDFYKYFGISKAQVKALEAKKTAVKPTTGTAESTKKQEADVMTQSEFNKLMENYNAERNKEKVSPWAEQAWKWAKNEGITDGTSPRGLCTREQLVTMLYRFLKLIRG